VAGMATYTVVRIVDATVAVDVDIDPTGLSQEQLVEAINTAADEHKDMIPDNAEFGPVLDTVEITQGRNIVWSSQLPS
jgi:hypothetical protein